jgi:hypothetical protein
MEAKQNPGARPNYLRKRLNLWLQSESAWLNLDDWDACRPSTPFTLDDLIGQGWDFYGALDLASKVDLNSFAALFHRGGRYRLLSWYWMPKEAALARALKEPKFQPWIMERDDGGPAGVDHADARRHRRLRLHRGGGRRRRHARAMIKLPPTRGTSPRWACTCATSTGLRSRSSARAWPASTIPAASSSG